MQDHVFLKSERYTDQQGRANRQGAHVDILAFEKRLVARLRKMGVPVFAHCVVRSEEEQARLFAQKVTKARPGQSPHQYGMAVDIIHGVHGWDLSRKQWEIIAHVADEVARALSIEITWGGDFDGNRETTHDQWDPAHFELTHWRKLKD